MIFTIHFKFKLQRNWRDARRQCCPRCCCSNSHCRNSSSKHSRSHCSNCQETRITRVRQAEATRTLMAYSLYQSVITFDTLIKFSATGTYTPEILVFLAQVSQYSFFSYHQLTSVEPSERVFGRITREAQFSIHLKFQLFHMVTLMSHHLYYI